MSKTSAIPPDAFKAWTSPDMQFSRGKPSAGAFFDSDFTKLDSLLAVALLYGLQGKNDCRMAVITCSRPDLATVGFIDHVQRYYHGPSRNFAQTPPVGMRTEGQPGTTPKAFLASYDNQVKSVIDTSDPITLLRNYLQAQYDQNAFFVLDGPAINLATALSFPGMKELIASKAKYLVVAGELDPALKAWPTPVIVAGPELGAALPFPDFTPEDPASPIPAAVQAWRNGPISSTAVAAALYAARPKEGYFKLENNRLLYDPAQKEKVLKAYAELVAAKPVIRMRFRPDEAKQP
jgi:hypothetical protein